jgi:hypothetical protein
VNELSKINLDFCWRMSSILLYLYQGERNSYHPLKMGEFPCAIFYEK